MTTVTTFGGKMNTKEKLIEESYNLFIEYGAHFSLTQLANKLGIKKQSIYAHFANKEALISSMLERKISSYDIRIDDYYSRISETDIKTQLYEYGLNGISGFVDKHMNAMRKRLSIQALFDDEVKGLLELSHDNFKSYVIKMLELGVEQGELTIDNIDGAAEFYMIIIRGINDNMIPKSEKEKQVQFQAIYEEFWKFNSTK